jgi:hypothetical protein
VDFAQQGASLRPLSLLHLACVATDANSIGTNPLIRQSEGVRRQPLWSMFAHGSKYSWIGFANISR